MMQDPAIGKEVDGYRIISVLGRGGMGVVYEAEDVALSRTVALKRIDPSLANDETFLRRFRSEARALARLDSPYIVSVHALRKTDLGLLIVMEYVDGGTLKDRIDTGPMGVGEALPVIRQMLTALKHAHGAGVIHRDIKPHNIMLTEAARVKVTDFGLAKVHRPDAQGTVTQGVYGTLNYMAPEQVRGLGEVDHRSDLYSLGMTIYEMLAGRLPFDTDSGEFAIMRAIVEEEMTPPDRYQPHLPEPLVQIVMTALEKDMEHRFQSAEEMQRAFEAFEKKHRGRDGASSETGPADTARAPASSNEGRLRQLGVLALLVLVLGTGGYAVYSQFVGDEPGAREPAANETAAPRTPVLSVSTEPAGAAVFVNGRIVGSTPLTDMPVTGDSFALRLQMDGYHPVDTTLHLASGARSSLDLRLESVSAPSEPTTADAGRRAADSDGGTTNNGGTTDTDEVVEETPAPSPARGTLDLGIEPSGTIRIDGTARGSGAVELPPGRHEIRFEHPRYGTKDTTVTVAEGQTTPLTCYFEQTINVNHEGAWGNVWINGENTGQSTPHRFTRGPGTYRVELRIRRDGYTVPEGEYFKSVGDRRFATTFSGNTKTVVIEPTCTLTKHALTFRATTERTR